MTYFLDTNIISYLLKGNPQIVSKLNNLILKGNDIKIPIVAYYEIKRGLLANKMLNKLAVFNEVSNELGIVLMTQNTFDICADVYAELRTFGNIIEDADIFIGCSAVENNAILITNNSKHLSRIKHLSLEEWAI